MIYFSNLVLVVDHGNDFYFVILEKWLNSSYVIPLYFLLCHLCNHNILAYIFSMLDVISSILMSCFNLILVNSSKIFSLILYFIH